MSLSRVRAACAVVAFVIPTVGCGDVCNDADEICGLDREDSGAQGEAECSGRVECQAECIVDADSCDILDNEALNACYTGCR